MSRARTRPLLVAVVAVSVALAAAPGGARAAAKSRQISRVVVAEFKAPDSARARSAILEIFSEHDDVEVVALGDILVVGRRIGADPTTPAGRVRLSEELGIQAWLDGTIEDGSAHFALHAPNGRVLATASLQGHRAHVLEGLAGPKVWEAMGPILSARERAKRAFQAQQDLAEKKVKARELEAQRQRKVVQDRIAQRAAQLKAAQALARTKRAAFMAELERQQTLVAKRNASEERDRKLAEQRQNAADEAEFMASLNESSGPPPAASAWGGSAAAARPEASAKNVWGASSAAATASTTPAEKGTNVWGGAASSAPASTAPAEKGTNAWGGAPASTPPAGKGTNAWGGAAASAAPTGHGTNVWGGASPAGASPANAPVASTGPSGSSAAPAVSPWNLGANSSGTAAPSSRANGMPATTSRVMMAGTAPRTAPAADGAAAPNQDGLSPATRAWLEQQGSH